MSVAVIGGGLLLLLLFALVACAAALVVIGLVGQKQRVSGGDPTPLDILKKRYASSEIDRDEFERMKEELKQGRSRSVLRTPVSGAHRRGYH